MANTRTLTCIVCPRGCMLTAALEGKSVLSVEGNLCPRGKKYAEDECTHPMRVVTSTIKTEDGRVVAVKTDSSIPKEKIFECMEAINKKTVSTPINVGDILIENVFGANIVATQKAD